MYVVVFVMPGQEGSQPSPEQLANIRDLAAGFGMLMAQQLHADGGAGEADELEGPMQGAAVEAGPVGDQIVGDENLVNYLEDCYKLQQ